MYVYLPYPQNIAVHCTIIPLIIQNINFILRLTTQDTNTIVSRCGKNRCKTCKNIVEGDSFCSNTTGKQYTVKSREAVMTCATKNVIYLINCKKCGIQYVGETSQALRSRMNNHRQRLNKMCDLFLYQHFCSNGHRRGGVFEPSFQTTTKRGILVQRASYDLSIRTQRQC